MTFRRVFRSLAPYLILIAIAVLYAAFLTRTFYWDGVLFSLNIEGVHRGKLPPLALIHPNHLLYSALGYMLYSAAVASGLTLRAVTVLQMFNVVLSAAAGFVIFVVAKRITNSYAVALFCWVLFAFGATWWKFSTDADAYVLSVLFLILTVMFALGKPIRIIPAAICHVFAMLFHELAVFTYVPVIVAIVLDSAWSNTKRFWMCVAYVFGTGACLGAVYLVCYFQIGRANYPSFLAWITSYASDSGFTHSLAQITGSYLTSYIKLFLGGKLSLIRDYFSVVVCVAVTICVAMLLIAAFLFRQSRAVPVTSPNRKATFVLWAWFLPSAIFLACWDPGSAFHKLFVWPPIVLLIGAYIARSQRLTERVHAFHALVFAMAAWNLGAFIYPHSHSSADPVLVLAQTIDRQLPRDATVYYRALDPDDWYLEYFAPGRTWLRLPAESTSWQRQLRSSAAAPVCLETTALDALQKDALQKDLSPHSGLLAELDSERRWDLVNDRHNIRLECLKEHAEGQQNVRDQ